MKLMSALSSPFLKLRTWPYFALASSSMRAT
jgi:hypothetical protein